VVLLCVGCCWAAGGGQARGRRPPSGGSRTRGSCGAALLLLGSMAVLQAKKTVGLLAAALHSGIDQALYEHHCAVLETGPQQPDQEIFIQPKKAQGRNSEVLLYDYPQMLVPKDHSQLLMHPGQKEFMESWVVRKKKLPGVWLEVTQRSPGQLVLQSLSFCCYRAMSRWMPMSSSCLAANN